MSREHVVNHVVLCVFVLKGGFRTEDSEEALFIVYLYKCQVVLGIFLDDAII